MSSFDCLDPQCSLFSISAHGAKVHCSVLHGLSLRSPPLPIKFIRKIRIGHSSRKLIEKKRFTTILKSKTAQNLEADDRLDQLLRETECEIMQAKNRR